MWVPPLLVLPLIIYNAVYFGLIGGMGPGGVGLGWASPVFVFNMPSGAVWSMNVADVLIILALGLLMIEGLRARRAIGSQIAALIGSVVVFVVYLGQFLLHPAASTSLFFTCLAMSFVDVVTRAVLNRRVIETYSEYED